MDNNATIRVAVNPYIYSSEYVNGHNVSIKSKGNVYWVESDGQPIQSYCDLSKIVGLDYLTVMCMMQGASLEGKGHSQCEQTWMMLTILICAARSHARQRHPVSLPNVEQLSMYPIHH